MDLLELPPPPTLYEAFVTESVIPDFTDIVSWAFEQGVWFLRTSDDCTIALPLLHHAVVEIRPKRNAS